MKSAAPLQHRFHGAQLAALICGALLACESSPVGAGLTWIYGSWTWTQSSGGIAGQVVTPTTAGYTLRYDFRADGEFRLFRNDSLALATSFTLRSEPSPWNGSPVLVLRYGQGGQGSPYYYVNQNGSDALTLIEPCADCYELLLIRRR